MKNGKNKGVQFPHKLSTSLTNKQFKEMEKARGKNPMANFIREAIVEKSLNQITEHGEYFDFEIPDLKPVEFPKNEQEQAEEHFSQLAKTHFPAYEATENDKLNLSLWNSIAETEKKEAETRLINAQAAQIEANLRDI